MAKKRHEEPWQQMKYILVKETTLYRRLLKYSIFPLMAALSCPHMAVDSNFPQHCQPKYQLHRIRLKDF